LGNLGAKRQEKHDAKKRGGDRVNVQSQKGGLSAVGDNCDNMFYEINQVNRAVKERKVWGKGER